MDIRQLAVPHAYEITPILRGDDRGLFLESYRADHLFEATGRAFLLRQGNISVSKKGVARGIHFADVGGEANKQSADVGGEANKQSADVGGEANKQSADVGGEANKQSADVGGEASKQSADVGGEANRQSADVDDAPTGQAKYVTAVAGSVTDFIIDIRVGSPTFGTWDAVELDDQKRNAVFLSEGLGHLFVATSESATVSYLTNDVYRPTREHGVTPVDPAIGLALPFPADQLLLSPQDVAAPTLAAAAEAGILPTWEACLARYAASAGLAF